MERYITEIVIGIYTIIHVLIFFYQKSKLDVLEKYNNIFDIEKVNRYVEMQEKSINLKAINMILDSEELNNTVKRVSDKGYEDITIELMAVVTSLLSVASSDERDSFINKNLPKSKHLFKEIYSEDNKL